MTSSSLVGGVVGHAVGGQRTVRVAGRRIDRTVEHEAPDAVGVGHRVHRAEGGAVAVAEVVEALDAERDADRLEVEAGVGGADLGEQRARCRSMHVSASGTPVVVDGTAVDRPASDRPTPRGSQPTG